MAAANLDLFLANTKYYMATLAPKDWFTTEERTPIYAWFSTHDQVLGYTEEENRKHLHVLFSSKQKKTGNVTRSLERMFETNQIEFTKGVTINVKSSSHPIGYFHYLTDEIKQGTRVMIKGWQLTWIQEQCRANLKSMPRKLLSKDVYTVNNKEGPDLIVKYAKAHHMLCNCKQTFIRCVARMSTDKYRFHNVKMKWLYCDVLALCGNTRSVVSHWEAELFNLD